MELKDRVLIKLQAIDKLNDDIKWIEKSKKELHKDIKAIKDQVRLENHHLLGRSALLIREDDTTCEGTCTKIEVEDDLELKLFFSYGNKKIKNIKDYKLK